MHRKKIQKLISGRISNNPLMLHGTGLASLLKLTETGILPVGNFPEKSTKNYLYFAPVRERFVKTKFYDELKGCTYNWAFRIAKAYAKIHAQDEYIAKELISAGISPEYANHLMYEFVYGFNLTVPKQEKQRALKLGDSWWSKVNCTAEKINGGVIIEAHESILELKLSIDPDGEGLRVFCPNGLDIKYIQGIKLLGYEEERIFNGKILNALGCYNVENESHS
jgi:hypothetical protein